MAISRAQSPSIKVAVTMLLALIFSITISKSVLAVGSHSRKLGKRSESAVRVEEEMKMVIGSRPPACVNKCLSCRPCLAALVISIRQMKGSKLSSREEDDSYYLLAWKCSCGDKLYKP